MGKHDHVALLLKTSIDDEANPQGQGQSGGYLWGEGSVGWMGTGVRWLCC